MTNETITLKAEIYDLMKSRQEVENILSKFASTIAEELGIEGEAKNDLQSYVDAIRSMKEKTEKQDKDEI